MIRIITTKKLRQMQQELSDAIKEMERTQAELLNLHNLHRGLHNKVMYEEAEHGKEIKKLRSENQQLKREIKKLKRQKQ